MNKSYFVWDAELYSVGDATIDEQHQRLLTVMNRLYVLIHDEGGIANIAGTTAMMQELMQLLLKGSKPEGIMVERKQLRLR